jgi:hypothetical protein
MFLLLIMSRVTVGLTEPGYSSAGSKAAGQGSGPLVFIWYRVRCLELYLLYPIQSYLQAFVLISALGQIYRWITHNWQEQWPGNSFVKRNILWSILYPLASSIIVGDMLRWMFRGRSKPNSEHKPPYFLVPQPFIMDPSVKYKGELQPLLQVTHSVENRNTFLHTLFRSG